MSTFGKTKTWARVKAAAQREREEDQPLRPNLSFARTSIIGILATLLFLFVALDCQKVGSSICSLSVALGDDGGR